MFDPERLQRLRSLSNPRAEFLRLPLQGGKAAPGHAEPPFAVLLNVGFHQMVHDLCGKLRVGPLEGNLHQACPSDRAYVESLCKRRNRILGVPVRVRLTEVEPGENLLHQRPAREEIELGLHELPTCELTPGKLGEGRVVDFLEVRDLDFVGSIQKKGVGPIGRGSRMKTVRAVTKITSRETPTTTDLRMNSTRGSPSDGVPRPRRPAALSKPFGQAWFLPVPLRNTDPFRSTE